MMTRSEVVGVLWGLSWGWLPGWVVLLPGLQWLLAGLGVALTDGFDLEELRRLCYDPPASEPSITHCPQRWTKIK
jgi:hypothetical protein